jgi:hypothetical protein
LADAPKNGRGVAAAYTCSLRSAASQGGAVMMLMQLVQNEANGAGTLVVLKNVGWAVTFAVVGAIVGIALILAASYFVPRLIERLTPNIDEEKELVRGNVAVAEYFGRVVAACIIGISIVIAAAVAAGIVVGLY